MNSNATNLGTGDAFTSVLSSLQNQRRRLEVISGNISNINTIGYKSSRMTFLEMLGQTVGKLYTPFEQGTFTATGSTTDIAINGQSFFIVKGETDEPGYTRAGAFYFNEDGVLVNGNQQAVQGWVMDENLDNEISSSAVGGMAAIGDISVQKDMIENAKATENVWFSGNLSAVDNRTREVWKMSGALTEADAPAVMATDLANLDMTGNETPLQMNDIISIDGQDMEGNPLAQVNFEYGVDGTTVGDLITSINNAFDNGGDPIALATLNEETGEIVLTAQTTGDSELELTLSPGGANVGSFTFPIFNEEVEGTGSLPSASASIVTYDSLGIAHDLDINFTRVDGIDNTWTWEIVGNNDEVMNSGSTGTISFDSDGKLSSFHNNNQGYLSMTPGEGGAEMIIRLHPDSSTMHGITQNSGGNSIRAREQDGYATGKLEGINVDEFGFIIGTFSNGVTKKLALLALAEFSDPTSLAKTSASTFTATQASGEATVGQASSFDTELKSGHLETSNVDLAEQFIQMIDAQKGYQAASRIVTTLNGILEETTRFGR